LWDSSGEGERERERERERRQKTRGESKEKNLIMKYISFHNLGMEHLNVRLENQKIQL